MTMMEEISTRTNWKTVEWESTNGEVTGGSVATETRSASVYKRNNAYDIYVHGKTNGIVPTKTMDSMDEVVQYLNAIA